MEVMILLLLFASVHSTKTSGSISRQSFLENELKLSLGDITALSLSQDEQKLDNIFMRWKTEEYDYWFKNPKYFNFSKSFFEYKDDIKKSKVYQLIENMPKAVLHVHINAILGPDFFINITYREDLFVCFEKVIKFKFSSLLPNETCAFTWERLSDVRRSVQNVTQFDEELKSNFTLAGSYHKDIDSVWTHFSTIFSVIRPLLKHRPVWEIYMYEALKKLMQDNVSYVEFRSTLYELYELDGTVHDPYYFVNITQNIVQEFKREHPDFIDARIISSYGRVNNDMANILAIAKQAKQSYPDFVAGFDLNGREDIGGPLVDYQELLAEAKDEVGGYYFHAGETYWYGTFADENLYDAVTLGSERIGHGVALLKHPLIFDHLETLKKCVEVSVISNNVLGLVQDVRLHPLSALVARGIQVAISSDDPGLWGAPPASADIYAALSGLSRRHGLAMLKKLAFDSIYCIAPSYQAKQWAVEKFNEQWNRFINDSLTEFDTRTV